MCHTQNILDSIKLKIEKARNENNLELANKILLSFRRKKAKMVKPSAILKIHNNKEITVKEIIKESLMFVRFSAICDNVILEYDQSDILEYIKDANSKYANPKKKQKISQVYTSLKKHTLNEFILLCSSMSKVSTRKVQWLKLIAANKLQCPVTNKKVSYCSYDVSHTGSYHYNFYSEDDQLFTVDHIIPRSKGGSVMKLKNLQPMIGKYNWRKGSNDNTKFLKNNKPKQ